MKDHVVLKTQNIVMAAAILRVDEWAADGYKDASIRGAEVIDDEYTKTRTAWDKATFARVREVLGDEVIAIAAAVEKASE